MAPLSSRCFSNKLQKSHLHLLLLLLFISLLSHIFSFIYQASSSVFSSLALHPSPSFVMLLSVQLASVTDSCQFKGLGFPFRAGAYMWRDVHACPIADFTTKIESPETR